MVRHRRLLSPKTEGFVVILHSKLSPYADVLLCIGIGLYTNTVISYLAVNLNMLCSKKNCTVSCCPERIAHLNCNCLHELHGFFGQMLGLNSTKSQYIARPMRTLYTPQLADANKTTTNKEAAQIREIIRTTTKAYSKLMPAFFLFLVGIRLTKQLSDESNRYFVSNCIHDYIQRITRN